MYNNAKSESDQLKVKAPTDFEILINGFKNQLSIMRETTNSLATNVSNIKRDNANDCCEKGVERAESVTAMEIMFTLLNDFESQNYQLQGVNRHLNSII